MQHARELCIIAAVRGDGADVFFPAIRDKIAAGLVAAGKVHVLGARRDWKVLDLDVSTPTITCCACAPPPMHNLRGRGW